MRRTWIALLSTALLTTFASAAPPPAGTASTAAIGGGGETLEVREGLLRELADREAAIAARPLARVREEVRRRAQELGVAAPAGELTALLYRKAHLEVAVARCALSAGAEAACDDRAALLAGVEARFEQLAGLAADDFRRGERRAAGPPDPGRLEDRASVLSFGSSSRTDPQHCVCSATVSNRDRWVGQHWGLECNGHASHGVCSSNLDSFHSAGTGAMTGKISLYHATGVRVRECPDDHRTCFKGPAPTKPGGGEWTNVCNCDTVHSQLSNPFAAFYGGVLTDGELVAQASFSELISDGPCGSEGGFTVVEWIEENDPICCDDPMGDLVASFALLGGTATQEAAVETQNCNGGSQSGVPPFCGEFGATVRLTTQCQTRDDDSFGSCYGRCGEVLPEATCHCDFACQTYGDCCWDYCNACASQGDMPPMECSVNGV